MCLYSQLIKNKKYQSNNKNRGNIPTPQDTRVIYVPIGCGNCIECRKQKAREWQVRLLEDIKTNNNGKFITLTFSNESIKQLKQMPASKSWAGMDGLEGYELDNEIATRAVRLFLERWRKQYGISLRHWLVTELGHNGTENIHLHGIIWTDDLTKLTSIWQYGYIWQGHIKLGKLINYVNEATVNYITKYINKTDEKHTTYKSKVLTSKGIGANYTNTYNRSKNVFKSDKTTDETYRTRTGHRMSLPIYYRNKIYTDHEREELWLQKLDKQTRWIRGEKIDISHDDKAYMQLLQWHQKQNEELGYGTNKIDYNKKIYEGERRKLMQLTRIKKAKEKQKQQEEKQKKPQ